MPTILCLSLSRRRPYSSHNYVMSLSPLDPSLCRVKQLVSSFVNDLKVGMPFPSDFKWPSPLPFNLSDPDVYAVAKEIYLGELCAVYDSQQDGEAHGASRSRSRSWNFWMIMLKNGNFDPDFGQCLATSTRGGPFFLPRFEMSSTKRLTSGPDRHNLGHLAHAYSELHTSAPKMPPKAFHASPRLVRSGNRTVVTLDRMSAAATSNAFPCFGAGCMNQPKVQHALSDFQVSSGEVVGLKGGFYGTYDITTDLPTTSSQFSVEWEKDLHTGSWVLNHKLRVSEKYPWLMLYLRADTASGVSGGYPWDTRGMMKEVP